ncbi:uncharacterized protein isoform X4 [Danio rerio]|uniref:Uncharacterized protein isoform X4 n=1 Tax=Danio rerio TaxID=7955 RepID=A0AC58HTR6_DANRE
MSIIQKVRYFCKRQIARVQAALSRFLGHRQTPEAIAMAGVTANKISKHITLLSGTPTGLGKTMMPRMESLVRAVSLLYFRAFKHQTVDYFNSAIDVFWNTPVNAPSLFFYSENDALCDYKSLEKVVELWRSRGLTVESKKWKESIHAGHLRTHPQEYLSTLDNFVQSLNIVPLKAKM